MHIDQRHHDKEPASKSEKIFIITISLAFLFMMSMEIMTNFEPKKLGALLFVIFWVPLLFIHEFGHAMMAKLLGWRVQRIVIGVGKNTNEYEILGCAHGCPQHSVRRFRADSSEEFTPSSDKTCADLFCRPWNRITRVFHNNEFFRWLERVINSQ